MTSCTLCTWHDKVLLYNNWVQLMQQITLTRTVSTSSLASSAICRLSSAGCVNFKSRCCLDWSLKISCLPTSRSSCAVSGLLESDSALHSSLPCSWLTGITLSADLQLINNCLSPSTEQSCDTISAALSRLLSLLRFAGVQFSLKLWDVLAFCDGECLVCSASSTSSTTQMHRQ